MRCLALQMVLLFQSINCVSVYVVTWLVAQHLHGRHELLAGLLVLALLVEQTAHVHIIVWVILGKLFHQRLEQTRGWEN